jgi:hypothetical protein
MREAADDAQLVRQLSKLGTGLRELDAGERGVDRGQRAANLFGSKRLGIERIEMRDAAPHPQEDDRLRARRGGFSPCCRLQRRRHKAPQQ